MADTSFLEIDENALDKGLVEQPTLFFRHSRKLADAKLALDEADAELDLVKADLSLAIRDFPKKFDLGDKITEGAITATIIRQEKYKKALRRLNECKHTVALLQSVVNALDHRKRALEKLVDLHGQNYFSTPRPRDEETNNAIDREKTRRMVEKTRKRKPPEDG